MTPEEFARQCADSYHYWVGFSDMLLIAVVSGMLLALGLFAAAWLTEKMWLFSAGCAMAIVALGSAVLSDAIDMKEHLREPERFVYERVSAGEDYRTFLERMNWKPSAKQGNAVDDTQGAPTVLYALEPASEHRLK